VDKAGHPLRVITTEGTEPNCKWALELASSLDAKCILADKAYDSDDIILSLFSRGFVPLIPPKINRKFQRLYDNNIYNKRHFIENTFLKVKEWFSLLDPSKTFVPLSPPSMFAPSLCSLLDLTTPSRTG
jgi:transposase